MSINFYKPPKSEINTTLGTQIWLFFPLLILLASKIFVLFLISAIPSPPETVRVEINYFQFTHQIIYSLASTVCIIGLLAKKIVFLFAYLLLFLFNGLIFLLNGSYVYQCLFDPTVLAVFILIIFVSARNPWKRQLKSHWWRITKPD